MKSALVIGVAGFIGRYVARYFSEQGWSVIGIDNSPPENAPVANLAKYYRLHLPDVELASVLQESSPDVCIHCAGRASVSQSITDPSADFHNGTVLTFEILNSLRLYSPDCRFIFLSSAAVYGNPESLPIKESQSLGSISPYGFHKRQCEQLCLEFTKVYDLPTSIVRIFSAYGPGLRRQVIWDICQKAIAQNNVRLQGTGAESRDFIHALDIARALLVVAQSAPMEANIYNLGSGKEMAIAELATLILDALECKQSPEFDGLVPTGTPLNWQADMSKLQALGFSPSVSIEKGIKTFANWCRAELIGV
jgi:UDP-glucose 4-epimerase